MPKFDTKTFFELTGKGGGPVAALGTSFGMPSCLINLGVEALNLLPSPLLNGIRGATAQGVARADDVVKALQSKLRFLNGIIEYDTEDGIFRFVSDSSKNGNDKEEGGFLNAIGGFLGAAGAAAGFAGRLYNNYQSTAAQIESIKDCLQSYKDYLDYSGGEAGNRKQELADLDPEAYARLNDSEYGILAADINEALQFQLGALEQLQAIDNIVDARRRDPSLEPQFTNNYLDILEGTGLNVEQDPPREPVEEVFRLEFGPPVSRKGKFILSVDGLYYDSQTSGIIPALMELESRKMDLVGENKWRLEYDPNLGGRGVPTSIKDLELYVNTILDPNILDESQFLKTYYDQDELLQGIIGQKNRRIYDISASLAELESTGASQILISNIRQVMLSETSAFLIKINKRKKQIELAVKLPVIYKGSSAYSPGEIPVNDFSYLEGVNFLVDIEQQRKITLNQEDVSGVVLPLEVKYTQQIETENPIVYEHLLINNIASGSIISDSTDLSGPSVSINAEVVNDGLFAMYNFLSVKTSTDASAPTFKVFNSADTGIEYNASLFGDVSSVFTRGLGIPYLEGVAIPDAETPSTISRFGNHIRLPEKPEFQDFIINPNGGTFETWIHVPELDGREYGYGISDGSVSGLYRLILANENTGLQAGVSANGDILSMTLDNGTDTINGVIFGFTRDVRFTKAISPTNDSVANSTDFMRLVFAPTQSYDSSSIGFISKSYNENGVCFGDNGWHGMSIDVWDPIDGVALSSCGKEFCHLALVLSPQSKEVKVYLDGVLLATSGYLDVFGQEIAPNIPSLRKNNSFEYSGGPKLDTFFTPWILGGGYTDGMPSGNFMGGEYGGLISGLKGHIGGTRFYSKALSASEILNNFNATKLFFKNIDVPNLMWEPINIST